ncbi:hypothetical protein HPB49_023284 [Dermacentor silvarum]|uniref:Uncharacterized protein n=1 Tax=Dermacentor silvarum TaxID=543639 RepID=A0ACB8CBX6_DERSI|nr:hypothetical protein HPB49_023284 [Dermacentor silvarum]
MRDPMDIGYDGGAHMRSLVLGVTSCPPFAINTHDVVHPKKKTAKPLVSSITTDDGNGKAAEKDKLAAGRPKIRRRRPLPRFPPTDYKVVFRPKGGLNIRSQTATTLLQTVCLESDTDIATARKQDQQYTRATTSGPKWKPVDGQDTEPMLAREKRPIYATAAGRKTRPRRDRTVSRNASCATKSTSRAPEDARPASKHPTTEEEIHRKSMTAWTTTRQQKRPTQNDVIQLIQGMIA